MTSRICRVASMAVWFAVHLVPPAMAASIEPRDLRQIAAASSDIIHAAAVAARCRWNDDHTIIVTETRFRVVGTIKGSLAAEVVVTTPGGKIGKLLVEVPGTAPFRVGEEAILFLVSDALGTKSIEGLSRGRFEVVVDGRTGARVVSAGLAAQLSQALGKNPNQKAAPSRTLPALDGVLADLRTLVRDVEAKGGR